MQESEDVPDAIGYRNNSRIYKYLMHNNQYSFTGIDKCSIINTKSKRWGKN